MKKYIIIILVSGMSMGLTTSCFEEYLDKAPEAGLDHNAVFSDYTNFRKYFDRVYWRPTGGTNGYQYYPMEFDFYGCKFTTEALTEAADQGRLQGGQTYKNGNAQVLLGQFGGKFPIQTHSFQNIRISNMALENIHLLEGTGAIDEDEINDFKGQAHFIRALCHFEMMRWYGPMPYLVKVLGQDDEWDLPRLSKSETLNKVAMDFDTSAYFFELAGKMRRDPKPGEPGHLEDPYQSRPTGVAAKAYKSRALLYAASPLNNEGGVAAWQKAAIAAWEALKLALENNYELLSKENMKLNYVGVQCTNEHLWWYGRGTIGWNSGLLAGRINGVFGNSRGGFSGTNPTMSWIDKYETKWGEPLNSQADRDAATAAGHYYEQNLYVDRDPRLDFDIIYNQSPCLNYQDGKAQIWYSQTGGVITYGQLLDPLFQGITRTGHYVRKWWGEASNLNRVSKVYTDPLFRLAELYLSYAEAANEAYGPNTPAPGATLSAVQAINIIRARINHIPVLPAYTGSTDAFRPRIKNERNIELSWEGHYYHDIRRWMDAPTCYAGPQIGMSIEKLLGEYDPDIYPTGFKHIRVELPPDRQVSWKDPMYYVPFRDDDNFKMKNFITNENW